MEPKEIVKNTAQVEATFSEGEPAKEEYAAERENSRVMIAYKIVSQLAASESGLLYRAIRDDTGAEVDVLVLAGTDASEIRRLKKRINLAGQLDHPAVARILETRLDGDTPTYLLEPIAERKLTDIVLGMPRADAQQLLTHGYEIASVVAAGHRLGLAHGHISPDSVRIRGDHSIQIDYVRSSYLETTSNEMAATLLFSAPEVAGRSSDPDAAADAFSLASLLVWLFTAADGIPGSQLREIRKRLEQWFAPLDVEQTDLDAFCETVKDALEVDPADRSSTQVMFVQLERLAQQAGVIASNSDETTKQLGQTAEWSDAGSGSFEVTLDGEQSRNQPLTEGDYIGRFRILQKLGEGGMGEVFKAGDPSDGSVVAIKVLRRILSETSAVRRFHKEARLLGEIKSPYVTNLLEVNEDEGLHYLVMEFVPGFDLLQLIRRAAPFPEKVALSIIADATRGLVSAHERGIIHRDIKPANILLACDPGETDRESDFATLTLENLKRLRVKLSDFGLARQLDQSDSMQMTQAGGVLGTPIYMSPEQFSNQVDVSPATDVYAIGITLFEMLAGKPPFKAPDLMQLMDMHRQEKLPLLPTLNPDVSEATWEIVQRTLAKKIQDRYADAGQLLQDIERLLRGEASNIAVHPQTPPHDPSEVFEEIFEWQLEGAAEDLWPHVSNTERINAAVGVPSVAYDTRRDQRGRLRKYGEFRLAGLKIGWEEHPFEWVEGQRLGILREFQQGPFVWFLSIVELLPQAGGGTLLRHAVRIKPRGLVGRMVATLEVTIKGKRNLNRVYQRIDRSVTGTLGNAPTVDPFSEPKKVSAARRKRLEVRLDRLADAGIDPNVVECLGSFLRDAPSQELARIRPLALARNFSIEAEPLITGCLLAAKEGLLDLHWDILCPTCRISSQVANTLQEIENHARCEVCDLDFDVDLANSVEMIFRANPEIRDADLGTYCIGGPEHSPHVVLQVRLDGGKRIELTPVLAEGEYVLRSSQLTYNYRLRALPGKGTTSTEIVLSPDTEPKLTSQIRAGRNVLTITNDYDYEIVIRLERSIPRKDVLTAAQASAMPAFREFFPDETPKLGQLINVATVTLLAVDIIDTDHLYFDLGDANAYSVVQRFQQLLQQKARKHSGALVKVSGTEVLFAFETPVDVVHAVVELADAIDQQEGLDVRFCAAVHRGTALATSTDGHLDFFGGTVHLVQRILRLAGAGELMMTEAVAADSSVVSAIRDRRLAAEVCDLPQLSQNGTRCQRLRIV